MQDQYEKNHLWSKHQEELHRLERKRQLMETRFILAIGGILILGVLASMRMIP